MCPIITLRATGSASSVPGSGRGAEHGRPHPREHFAGENLFQGAANRGPLVPAPLGVGGGVGEAASRHAQRSRRIFEAVQYCSMLAAGSLPPRIKTGPWAETMAASSISSRECMPSGGSKADAEAKNASPGG